MSDYGPFDDYMSGNNTNKCPALVQLLVSAHNNMDEDIDGGRSFAAGNFMASIQFKQIPEHIRNCSRCKNHPLLKIK